jgi:hypothetical protein
MGYCWDESSIFFSLHGLKLEKEESYCYPTLSDSTGVTVSEHNAKARLLVQA